MTTIQEAKTRVGEILPSISGILTSIYPPKTGTNNNGAWSLQNGEISQNGDKIKVCFSNREVIDSSRQGSAIALESKGTKFGLKGVLVKEETHKGQTYIQLRITGTAVISFPNSSPQREAPEPQEGGEDFDPMPPPKPTQNAPKASTGTNCTPVGIEKARHRFMQYANLYQMAWNAASFLAESSEWDNATAKDVATTFFIQGTKEGLVDTMPKNGPIGSVVKGEPENEDDMSKEDLF